MSEEADRPNLPRSDTPMHLGILARLAILVCAGVAAQGPRGRVAIPSRSREGGLGNLRHANPRASAGGDPFRVRAARRVFGTAGIARGTPASNGWSLPLVASLHLTVA
jgi:hypothetical protein